MLDPAAFRRRSFHHLVQELLHLLGTAVAFGAVAWLLLGPGAAVGSPRLRGRGRGETTRDDRVGAVASPVANAFVVGIPGDAAVAITEGLFRLPNERQMAGLLAHEVSHLRRGDTSIMNVSDVVARLAQWMAWVGLWWCIMTVSVALFSGVIRPALLSGVLVIVPPTFVTLTQLALCRSREYDADLDAVLMTHGPEGLAQALVALD